MMGMSGNWPNWPVMLFCLLVFRSDWAAASVDSRTTMVTRSCRAYFRGGGILDATSETLAIDEASRSSCPLDE